MFMQFTSVLMFVPTHFCPFWPRLCIFLVSKYCIERSFMLAEQTAFCKPQHPETQQCWNTQRTEPHKVCRHQSQPKHFQPIVIGIFSLLFEPTTQYSLTKRRVVGSKLAFDLSGSHNIPTGQKQSVNFQTLLCYYHDFLMIESCLHVTKHLNGTKKTKQKRLPALTWMHPSTSEVFLVWFSLRWQTMFCMSVLRCVLNQLGCLLFFEPRTTNQDPPPTASFPRVKTLPHFGAVAPLKATDIAKKREHSCIVDSKVCFSPGVSHWFTCSCVYSRALHVYINEPQM